MAISFNNFKPVYLLIFWSSHNGMVVKICAKNIFFIVAEKQIDGAPRRHKNMGIYERKLEIFEKNGNFQGTSKLRHFFQIFLFRKKIGFHTLLLQKKYLLDLRSQCRSVYQNIDIPYFATQNMLN